MIIRLSLSKNLLRRQQLQYAEIVHPASGLPVGDGVHGRRYKNAGGGL